MSIAEIQYTNNAQVEKDEHPQEVEASVLLPHEVFGALHSMGAAKAGGICSNSSNPLSTFSNNVDVWLPQKWSVGELLKVFGSTIMLKNWSDHVEKNCCFQVHPTKQTIWDDDRPQANPLNHILVLPFPKQI